MKKIFLFLIICVSCGTIYAQNEKDSLDAETALLMFMSMPPVSDSSKDKKYPLPSHFSYLEKYLVSMPNNEKVGLVFIDSDGNKDNYEYFEYIHLDSNESVKKRGIITHVKFRPGSESGGYDRSIVLNGIALNKNDLDDYAPDGIWREHLRYTDMFDFIARIIDDPSNNRAFVRMPQGVSYGGPETYVKYLHKYESDLEKNPSP